MSYQYALDSLFFWNIDVPLTEGMTEKLVSLYYDKLKEKIAPHLPDSVILKPVSYITSGMAGPARAWIANMQSKTDKRLSVDIGLDGNMPGILVSNNGYHRSWADLQATLLRVAQRFDERIQLAAKATQRAQKQNLKQVLDGIWANPTIGPYTLSLDDQHHEARTIRYYKISGPNIEMAIGVLLIASPHNKFTQNIIGEIQIDDALPHRIRINLINVTGPNKVKQLLKAAREPFAVAEPHFDRHIYVNAFNFDGESRDKMRKWGAFQYWRALHAITTNNVVEDIPPPEMKHIRDHQSTDDPILKQVRDNMYEQGGIHIVNTWQGITATVFTEFGPAQLFVRKNAEQYQIEIKITSPESSPPPPTNGPPHNSSWLTQDPERSITTSHSFEADELLRLNFYDLVMADLSQAFSEGRIRNDLLTEDEIDDDLLNAAKEIIEPILRQHPDIAVKITRQVTGRVRYRLLTLEKPDRSPIVLVTDGERLSIGSPGRAYSPVSTEDELIQYIASWVTSGRSPRPQSTASQQPAPAPPKPSKKPIVDIDKSSFFPRTAYALSRKIPGRQVSTGTPFTLAIHAKNIDFPTAIFTAMDLHRVGGTTPNFIGWIGGTIDEVNHAMYIDEVQSDLMQRTLEMTNQQRFNETIAATKMELEKKLRSLRRELAQLYRSAEFAPIQDRYRLGEQIQQTNDELTATLSKSRRVFKLSDHSAYKSKVENTFKHWIQAFYHTAFNYARQLSLKNIYIITSTKIGAIWGKARGKEDDDTSVFARAYDRVAENLGAVREGDWWHIELNKIPMKEYLEIRQLASTLNIEPICEGIDGDQIRRWLEHAGFTLHGIKGNFPDSDYSRLSFVVTKINPDGTPSITQELNDLEPEAIQRALSFVDQEHLDVPIEASPYDLEELERDASLLITAHRMVGNVPYGIAIFTLDDPNAPQFTYDPEEHGDPGHGLSDEDLFGIDPDRLEDLWNR